MSMNPFTPAFEALPSTLPVFPLPGAIVLPHAQLHLNVFEPRYLNMVSDALGARRMFGMVQPDPSAREAEPPEIYRVGCAGRITSFSETDDGRLLIVLTGVCRYTVTEEIPTIRGYRRARVDWSAYAADLLPPEPVELDRAELAAVMRAYLDRRGLQADWESLDKLPLASVVDFLAMHLPLPPPDKQTVLEARSPTDRADVLLALARMALAGGEEMGGRTRH